ncbi:hypothetical protein NP233_g3545 [Leucocoprinus birnbaumii]|uniref:Smr domain-containing protein n=1 Tax=Leucocoprinus birnbaumii TaxID=56174 RepID=A0AAD5YSR1_9AGAR|nr:hypothetical protein NP233_g3545 [Leucocoprinus birnbaumii]
MLGILKAIISFVCGVTQQPTHEQAPPPQVQQQHQYPPPQQQPWQRPPAEHKPQHGPSKPHRPPVQRPQQHPAPQRPPHHYSKDQILINQQNPHYVSLRSRANEEGDAMAKCFEESHQAYSNRDGALAKELSNKGKQHQKRMEELNKQASDWIFVENNKDSQAHEVDLHGLYVKEAITYTDLALQQARARGDKEIHLIVGKGLHSKNGAAKLKPAIEELMHKYQLSAELDPNNSGVLIVQLDSSTRRGVGADEITRRLERSDDGCIIM